MTLPHQYSLKNIFKPWLVLALFVASPQLVASSHTPYVLTLSAGLDKDSEYLYGLSAIDTKGKGNLGLYAELLFSYKDEEDSSCISGTCIDVDVVTGGPAFTMGVSYGFTDSVYGLAGAGVRFKSITTEPSNGSCDDDDDDTTDYSDYCEDDFEVTPSAQIGFLYVTPIQLSFMGTINTDKSLSFGIGYQF